MAFDEVLAQRVRDVLLDDEELVAWVAQARAYVRSLPPRTGRA